jgi:hypothetical protein
MTTDRKAYPGDLTRAQAGLPLPLILTGVGILQLRGRGVVKSINGGGRERTPTMKVNRQTF